MRHAMKAWQHLTPREQKKRRVYVAVHLVDVPADDPRTAEQLYNDLMDAGDWPHSWNVIPLPAE